MIQGMNHFTVLTDDLDKTLGFYVDLLGLKPGPRPDLGFPGAWLYVNGSAVLHIIAGRPLPEQRSGVLDHMAFSASGLADVKAKLDAKEISYELRRSAARAPGSYFATTPVGPRWSSISIRRNRPD